MFVFPRYIKLGRIHHQQNFTTQNVKRKSSRSEMISEGNGDIFKEVKSTRNGSILVCVELF
jgi:hypothetical protein